MATRTGRNGPRQSAPRPPSSEKIARLEAAIASLRAKVDRLLDERKGLRAALRAARVRGKQTPKSPAPASHEEAPPADALPPYPPADAQGYLPAVEFAYASLARAIITRRKAAGWSQAELAARAGVRTETVNRLEGGRHSPNVRTVDKIDAAFKAAGV